MKLSGTVAWRIDAGTGWRGSSRANVFVDGSDMLTIRPLTGRASALDGAEAVVGPDRCPSSLAADCRGRLFVLDAATSLVTQIGTRCERTWENIGGIGSAARQFRAPRGFTVLPSGALAVADTGNHRIQVFAPTTTALLLLLAEFDRPWDVASDSRGRLYVANRGNARIVGITPDGRWSIVAGDGFLQAPVRVAAGPDGVLAVIDADLHTALLFSRDRALPRVLPVAGASSVAFGSDGALLFVGDESGSIHTFAREGTSARYERVGTAATGMARAIVALAPFGNPPRLALVVEGETDAVDGADADTDAVRTLWQVNPSGGYGLTGSFVSERIDSRRERHQWHRVRVQADVPAGATVRVESATSDDDQATAGEGSTLVWARCLDAREGNPDCLVQSGPGRYLWIRLTLGSNGRLAPAIRSIDVSLGESDYLQYLPAVFQEDEESRRFLGRFLAIFQSGFEELDELVDRLGDLFDPHRVGANHLTWLAGLVGLLVDPTWTEQEFRAQLAAAVASYTRRGTADGLQTAIRTYADVETRIVEHFRLRRLARLSATASLDGSSPLWSPDRTERLQLGSHSQLDRVRLVSRPEPAIEALDWGANRFTVLFDADPYHAAKIAARVERVVEREKPAHTEASICPVFPRMRVGVQARLGVDASVGEISYTVLNRLATLNYDTVLGCSDHERSLTTYGTALRPRVGESTRLA